MPYQTEDMAVDGRAWRGVGLFRHLGFSMTQNLFEGSRAQIASCRTELIFLYCCGMILNLNRCRVNLSRPCQCSGAMLSTNLFEACYLGVASTKAKSLQPFAAPLLIYP